MTAAKCPLCGSSTVYRLLTGIDRLHGTPGQWPLYRCNDCQIGFLHPMPNEKEIERFYPQAYYAYAPPTLPAMPEKAIKRLEFRLRRARTDCYAQRLGYPAKMKHGIAMRMLVRIRPPQVDIPPFVPGGTLLDIGCGAGQYLLQMQDMGWKVRGVEPNADAAAAARAAGLDVAQGTLASARLEDASIAVARLNDVLEHVPDPQALLQEIGRILVPGGRLQITLPNLDAWTFSLFGSYWFPLEIPRHLFFFNPASLRRIATDNGYTIASLQIWPHKEVDVIPSLQYWLQERHPAWFTRLDKSGRWKLIRKVFAFPKAIAHLSGRSSAMTAWLIRSDEH